MATTFLSKTERKRRIRAMLNTFSRGKHRYYAVGGINPGDDVYNVPHDWADNLEDFYSSGRALFYRYVLTDTDSGLIVLDVEGPAYQWYPRRSGFFEPDHLHPYPEAAHKPKLLRVTRRRRIGGVREAETCRLLEKYGLDTEFKDPSSGRIMSVKEAAVMLPPERVYLVSTGSHSLVCAGGLLADSLTQGRFVRPADFEHGGAGVERIRILRDVMAKDVLAPENVYPKRERLNGYCVPVALAILTGKPLEEIEDDICALRGLTPETTAYIKIYGS